MILWLLIGIYQQLQIESICLASENVNKAFLFGSLNKRNEVGLTNFSQNEILLFITDDVLKQNENRNNNNNIFQNVIINFSKNLYKNLIECNGLNLFVDSKCFLLNKTNNIYINNPDMDLNRLKILTYRLNSKLSFNTIKSIFDKINLRYVNQPHISLNSIFLISNSKFIKLFKLVFEFSNNLVFYLDTNNYSMDYKQLDYDEIKFDLFTKQNNVKYFQRDSGKFSKQYKAQFLNINPTISYFFDIIAYFRTLDKLENINIYVSNNYDIHNFYEQKKNNHLFDINIDKIDKLIKNLNFLSNVTSPNDEIVKKVLEIENFFFSNDLLVLKCSASQLYTILNLYNKLRSSFYKDQLFNITFTRYLLWISDNNDFKIDENLIINIKKLCYLFQIYSLNWKIDLDFLIYKMFHRTSSINQMIESGTFTLTLVNKNFQCSRNVYFKAINYELNFKLKNNRLFLLESLPNEYDSPLIMKEIINDKKTKKKIKRSYRIVSNLVEPFVIVSQLDEHLVFKDECKDGLPCLDIESDLSFYKTSILNSTLGEEMLNVLNKEQMIGIIKGFKYFPDDGIKSYDSNLVKTKCCTGYMINLLQKLSNDLDFEFEFYFTHDKKYGNFDKRKSKWNGVINHVVSRVAHIAVGPLSLTEDRSKHVDFSVPFLYSGYSLLIKQEKKGVDDLWMFMRPFTNLHWAVIGLFGLASAISLALLEFNSPFGLNPNGRQRARNYTLGSAISMVISLMFMHTMPAKSPKSWAGKWTQNFIASFALIFIATYTAKMASILSAGQDSRSYKGLDDRELLNLKRGYLESSSIESHMCKNPKEIYKSHCNNSILLSSDDEGIKSVLNGTLDVYISDHLLLNYLRFKETNCNLQLTGKDFIINGYAFALSKYMNKKDKNDFNIQLLDYYETGYLDELYNKWFNKRIKCNRRTSDDKIRIDVDQYKGVFAYLGLGMLAAVLVLLLEQVLYKLAIPFLREKPNKSSWKSLKLMFFSQRFYRIVHSEEYYDATHSAKEFINVFKRRDFEAIFQKSFRKKQLESMHGSQLRKRPKLWALIEASTERRSRDLMIQAMAESNQDDKLKLQRTITSGNIDLNNLPKDKIIILKYDEVENDNDNEKKVNSIIDEQVDSLNLDKLNSKRARSRENSLFFVDEIISDEDQIENDKTLLELIKSGKTDLLPSKDSLSLLALRSNFSINHIESDLKLNDNKTKDKIVNSKSFT